MPEGSVYICFITPFFFLTVFWQSGPRLRPTLLYTVWQLITRIHNIDLGPIIQLFYVYIYLYFHKWAIIVINTKDLFRNEFVLRHWQLKSKSDQWWNSQSTIGRQTCRACQLLKARTLSNMVRFKQNFFVHIANFLLYLNKISNQADHHRKPLKKRIFCRESAMPVFAS